MNPLKVVGPPPFGFGSQERPLSGAATLWIEGRILVTLPMIHAMQADMLAELPPHDGVDGGMSPGGSGEAGEVRRTYALLHLTPDSIDILLSRNGLEISEAADTLLQEHYPKYRIRFSGVRAPGFIEFIKRKGDFWRVASPPSTVGEMRRFIEDSLAPIAGEPLFYYNPNTGTRFLTVHQLANVARLTPEARLAQLEEVRAFLGRPNARGAPEVELWPKPVAEPRRLLQTTAWPSLTAEQVEETLARIVLLFREAVPAELRVDDSRLEPWRNAMFRSLSEEPGEARIDHLGGVLGPEFYRQVGWLPGVHFDGEEWVFDPLFDLKDDVEAQRRCDWVARALVANVVREYADLDYINVARIIRPMSEHPAEGGRRDVLLMEFKRLSAERETLRVVRFHKWGIREHLDAGNDLLRAILRAHEYADYIFSRRLGCRQLGMSLAEEVTLHYIPEEYLGTNVQLRHSSIWAYYSERDFIAGVATNRIPEEKYSDGTYSLQVAALLGHAAALNLIVGRIRKDPGDNPWRVIFDQGDELMIHNREGEPYSILVCDHSHSFGDYESPLKRYVREYARPVNRRTHLVPDPPAFADEYLRAFRQSFRSAQERYRRKPRAFDNLFLPQQSDGKGNFADRWQCVLRRLNSTSPEKLAEQLLNHLVPLGGNP